MQQNRQTTAILVVVIIAILASVLFRRDNSLRQRAIDAVAERTGDGGFEDVTVCSDHDGGGYVTLWYVPYTRPEVAPKYPFPVFFLVEFKGESERVYIDRELPGDVLTQLRVIKAQTGNSYIECNELLSRARDAAEAVSR